MTNAALPQPVFEMLVAIDRKDPPMWPLFLARSLERRAPGKSIKWAAAFLRLQLRAAENDLIARRRHEWLAELERLISEPLTLEELARRSREIWYTEGRDAVQAAISRLYEVLAGLLNDNQAGCCKAVAWAVLAVASPEDG